MKKYVYLASILTLVLFSSSCADNKTKIGEGAGIGGVLGATAGGIIGHQSGDTVGGALIGGALGATGGAVAGSQIDK